LGRKERGKFFGREPSPMAHPSTKTKKKGFPKTLYKGMGGGGVAVQLHPFLTFTLVGVSGQSNVVKKRINRLTDLTD